MQAQIAQHLNVAQTAIITVQEWANVLWVRVAGIGCRFVSKKVVAAATEVKMETKIDRANKIVAHLGHGKVWVGGKIVRVYFKESGYLEIGKFGVNCSKLKHPVAYYNLRDAGLLQGEFVDQDQSPVISAVPDWQRKGYVSQLDYDMEDPNGKYYG